MKSKLRYHLAVLTTKLAKQTIKLLGRKSTHSLGQLALRIDPEVLKHLPKAHHRVAITGTNGKTSVSNLVASFLSYKQVSFLNNSYGSNILQGTTTALIDGVNLLGTSTKEYAVLEIDELASRMILPEFKPQFMAITNLFRDSYRRNAHVEFIFDRLNQFIQDDIHLILNADDLISSQLKPNNPRTYFSIAPLEDEVSNYEDLINDLTICPVCEHHMEYQFQHYHHIGRASCPNCGFTNPKPDYQITHRHEDHFILNYRQKEYRVNYSSSNVVNLYNVLVAIVILHSLKFELVDIIEFISNPNFPTSRYEELKINDKTLITLMGKDQNPVAVTRAFDYIRKYDRTKNIGVILVNQTNAHGQEHENVAYLYDVNFEYLNQPNIKRIGFGTARYLEYQARMEFTGYPKDQIVSRHDELDLIQDFSLEHLDTIFLIPGTKNLKEVYKIKESFVNQLSK